MQEEMESSSKSTKCTSRIELPAKGVIGVTVVAEENTVFYTNPYTNVQYRLCHAHKNE